VFIVLSIYFVIESVQKLLDAPLYMNHVDEEGMLHKLRNLIKL